MSGEESAVSLQGTGVALDLEGGNKACSTSAPGTTRDKCLAHHKNDSGSYDAAPNGLLASSSGTASEVGAITNGKRLAGSGTVAWVHYTLR